MSYFSETEIIDRLRLGCCIANIHSFDGLIHSFHDIKEVITLDTVMDEMMKRAENKKKEKRNG